MFKELGLISSLLKQAPKIKEEMEKLQQRLGTITADGDAGAGMVKVKVSGRMEVLSCSISDEALKSGDRELLEDLIKGATNQALEKVRRLVAEESSKVASTFGLPGLPDLGAIMGK
jgi:hypothetical protein